MAKKENTQNQDTKQEKKKKGKKPFLTAGLVLLGLALAIGAGWFFTGSFVLLRNSIYLVGTIGAGVGLGTVVKNAIFGRGSDNSNKKSKTRTRTRGLVRTQQLEQVPVQTTDETRTTSPVDTVGNARSSRSSNNKKTRG